MDLVPVLISLTTLIGAALAAYVAWRLGRKSAIEDHLRVHELQSVNDTRDRLLDMARMASAVADLEREAILEFGAAIRASRYPRARNRLIADDRLIEALWRTIPELLRTFPSVSEDLRSELAGLSNAIREAMFDQEKHVIATGKTKLHRRRSRIDA